MWNVHCLFTISPLDILHYLKNRELALVPHIGLPQWRRRRSFTVFYSSNTGIVCSNSTQGIDVCLHFGVVALSCVGRGIASGRSNKSYPETVRPWSLGYVQDSSPLPQGVVSLPGTRASTKFVYKRLIYTQLFILIAVQYSRYK
jgi:hypothetical protein